MEAVIALTRKLLFYLLIPAIPLVLTFVFFLRTPVLLVTDNSFVQLYGTGRSKLREVESSIRLFRRVRPVIVNETASPDLINISVQAASPRPYLVIFPVRYMSGATHYSRENPGVPLLVMEGRGNAQNRDPGIKVVSTDRLTDFFRAGNAAVILSQQTPGSVIFFHDDSLDQTGREAFNSGLRAEGDFGESLLVSAASNHQNWDNVTSVVIKGAASSYFDRNSRIPAVLFTWLDPAVIPVSVKVIFDDSPWAILVRAVRMYRKSGDEFIIPSQVVVLYKNLDDRGLVKKLRGLSGRML